MGDADGARAVLEKVVVGGNVPVKAAALLAMIYTASGQRKVAEAMRDRVVAKAGARADALKKAIDEAITGAEAELEQMKLEQAAGGQAAQDKVAQDKVAESKRAPSERAAEPTD